MPYHPPFILALFALLIGPTVIRMLGEPLGWSPLIIGTTSETANAAVASDDIWVGFEKFTRDFTKQPEVKLICQISEASLSTLTECNCLVIPRTGDARIEAGSCVNLIRY